MFSNVRTDKKNRIPSLSKFLFCWLKRIFLVLVEHKLNRKTMTILFTSYFSFYARVLMIIFLVLETGSKQIYFIKKKSPQARKLFFLLVVERIRIIVYK